MKTKVRLPSNSKKARASLLRRLITYIPSGPLLPLFGAVVCPGIVGAIVGLQLGAVVGDGTGAAPGGTIVVSTGNEDGNDRALDDVYVQYP